MSEIKVNSIKGVAATTAALTINNTDGTCTANITNNLSNRNIIINGGMTISQRKGTTETIVPDNTSFYSVDRFGVFDKLDGGNNFTYQQTTNPVPDGFSHALKINTAIADTSIANNNYAFFYQIVEGQNIQQANLGTSAAKPLTLSFHVYSNKIGTYTVGLVNQGTFNRTFLKEFTISSQATWEKKTITFPAITDGTWNDVRVQWCLSSGTDNQGAADTLLTTTELATSNQVNFASAVNNSFHITGVQLEVGSVATDFEYRSFGQELALCQRYFYAMLDGTLALCENATMYSSSNPFFSVPFPVEMRIAPSLEVSDGSQHFLKYENGGGTTFQTLSRDGITSTKIAAMNASVSGTAGNACMIRGNNASTRVHWSAEL
tara:strand:+ start:58 stop:1188 length:1131 start_codon:yes stop_codon:yes gene_type:complete